MERTNYLTLINQRGGETMNITRTKILLSGALDKIPVKAIIFNDHFVRVTNYNSNKGGYYFMATDMEGDYKNKEIDEFLRLPLTKKFIAQRLSCWLEFVERGEKGKCLIKTYQNKIWFHSSLAIRYANFLDKLFAESVSGWLGKYLVSQSEVDA